MPKISHHSELMTAIVRFEERQISIFKRLDKIEIHLAKINGKVQEQEIKVAEIRTYGAMAVLVVPILINGLMRLI
jgi:hypothetical protein